MKFGGFLMAKSYRVPTGLSTLQELQVILQKTAPDFTPDQTTITLATSNVKWSNIAEVPTFFPPSFHKHSISDIMDINNTTQGITVNTDWASVQGKPTTFTPSTHIHNASQVIGVVKSVNGNAPDSNGNLTVVINNPLTAEQRANLGERVWVRGKSSNGTLPNDTTRNAIQALLDLGWPDWAIVWDCTDLVIEKINGLLSLSALNSPYTINAPSILGKCSGLLSLSRVTYTSSIYASKIVGHIPGVDNGLFGISSVGGIRSIFAPSIVGVMSGVLNISSVNSLQAVTQINIAAYGPSVTNGPLSITYGNVTRTINAPSLVGFCSGLMSISSVTPTLRGVFAPTITSVTNGLLSPSSYNSAITVGQFDIIVSGMADIVPNAFSFTDIANAWYADDVHSNKVLITGIDTTVTGVVTRTGLANNAQGFVYVNGGIPSNLLNPSTNLTLNAGDQVEFSCSETTVGARTFTLTINGVSDTWNITKVNTGSKDNAPDAIVFSDITDALQNSYVESNTVTISGLNTSINVGAYLTQSQISISGGPWVTSASGNKTIANGDTLKCRGLSSTSNLTTVTCGALVNGSPKTFNVLTRGTLSAPTLGFAGEMATRATEIDLNWDAITYATGYDIEYGKTTSYELGIINIPSQATTRHTFTGLDISTTYHFKIRATGAGFTLTSPWSATDTALTTTAYILTSGPYTFTSSKTVVIDYITGGDGTGADSTEGTAGENSYLTLNGTTIAFAGGGGAGGFGPVDGAGGTGWTIAPITGTLVTPGVTGGGGEGSSAWEGNGGYGGSGASITGDPVASFPVVNGNTIQIYGSAQVHWV
jgi:hypothetical protein